MEITFLVVTDLILNTLKNSFLLDDVQIVRKDILKSKVEKERYSIALDVISQKQEGRKYLVNIFTQLKDKRLEVTSIDCDVVVKTSEFYPYCLMGSFTADGVLSVSKLTQVLKGATFTLEEVLSL